MPLFNLTDLQSRLGPNQRIIGIDPGAKIIGLALSDVTRSIATPHSSLKRGKLHQTASEIGIIAKKENAGGLIIGWPLSMDGTMGPAAQAVRDWALALTEATNLPGALWDERLSSAAVNRFLTMTADLSRGKRAAVVDKMAAAYILQGALDARKEGQGSALDPQRGRGPFDPIN